MAKSFSVLTVSKRTGWEHDAIQCLKAQTVTSQIRRRGCGLDAPTNWIVVSELERNCYTDNHLFPCTYVPAPPKTKLSNLNASLNEGLRHIDTDYVIFYQDFIELKEDCFEKLLALVDERTFVTTCTPNYDGSDDGRYTGVDMPRACRPEEWEANVSIAPMRILRELGGFDEEYDWGWSWDNVNVAERAAMLGAKFILDESNRPKLYPHEMSSHQTLPLNAQRHSDTMKAIRNGTRPIKNKYL